MNHQISPVHPAVVLRSQYKHLKSLLAVAMIAVVGLTATTVVLVTDDGERSSGSGSASAVSSRGPAAPLTRYDGGPEEGTASAARAPAARYDGGPEEGAADVGTFAPRATPTQAPADGRRYDGGPEEGTRGLEIDESGPVPFSGTR